MTNGSVAVSLLHSFLTTSGPLIIVVLRQRLDPDHFRVCHHGRVTPETGDSSRNPLRTILRQGRVRCRRVLSVVLSGVELEREEKEISRTVEEGTGCGRPSVSRSLRSYGRGVSCFVPPVYTPSVVDPTPK